MMNSAANLSRSLRYEELENRLLLVADFGDAPLPYPTLESQGGPQHVAIGPTLGSLRDTEANGSPASLLADGDDSTDESDEDGVIFESLRVGQLNSSIAVTVSNAPSGAYLDAWIDFDRDGSWSGANETIAASVLVVNGENEIQFDVPSFAGPGETYARFRLSTVGGLGPTGLADDGEVEDYHVTILPPVSSGGQFGLPHFIASDINDQTLNTGGTIGVSAADLDDDGDMDIIASAALDGILFWYENQGSLGFEQHEISRDLPWVNEIVPTDLDKDGDVDLVTVAARDGYSLAWHENDGEGGFQTHVLVVGDRGGASALDVVDIDVDGDLDIIVARDYVVMSQGSAEVVLYRNTGNQFAAEVLAESSMGGNTYDAVDIDRDGDIDIVEAVWGTRSVNLLRQQDGIFTRESLATTEGYGNSAVAAQFDDEDGLDILASSWSDGKIRWLENNGSSFANHELYANSREAAALWAADMNGDGNMDALTGWQNGVRWINVLDNQGYSDLNLVTSIERASDFFPADMDGDGDLDVVVASGENDDIAWYENTDYRISQEGGDLTPTIGEDGTDSNYGYINYLRHGALANELTITLSLGGVAVHGVDYILQGVENVTATTAQLTFAAGSSFASLLVQPLQDSDFELDEIVSIEVLDGLNYQSSLKNPQSVLIADDDPADFGDAPYPYPTTRDDDGAKHGAAGLRLGSVRDAELDGNSSVGATGDNTSGAADEDGVTWGTIRVGQLNTEMTIEVEGVSGTAFVDAWVDFNGDGNWGGVGEQILAKTAVTNGLNILTFDVPSSAFTGSTYARVRLSSVGSLSYVGAALDGEVEDYEITILPPIQSAGIFVPHSIAGMDGESTSTRSAQPADIDNDGDMDVISNSGQGLVWHENNGDGSFAARTIANSEDGTQFVQVMDFDRDGDLDVLTISADPDPQWLGNWIALHENLGGGEFETKGLVRLYSEKWMTAVDFDLDGDTDFVLGERWFENIGNGFEERGHSPDSIMHQVIDVDGDGDMDLVTSNLWDDLYSNTNNGGFGWRENNGYMRFTTHRISASDATWVRAVDVDLDGDLDFIATRRFDDRLSWYENDGEYNFTARLISSPQRSGGYHFTVADIDGDNDPDIFGIGSEYQEIWSYRNDGQGDFVEELVLPFADQIYTLSSADMDGDGDLDFISGQHSSYSTWGDLTWYENISSTIDVSVSSDFISEEDSSSIDYEFQRRGSLANDLTVNFSVSGSALFVDDYEQSGAQSFDANSGTVYFPVGVDVARVTMRPLSDSLLESNETISLRIEPGVDYAIGQPDEAIARIIDNEPGDFGDAPASYGTLLLDDGARHLPVGPTLGYERDLEPDGFPSTLADGDDLSTDDEDGVTFSQLKVGQLHAVATVHVSNRNENTRLDAWIDFDGDGTWSGSSERIANSVLLTDDESVIEFDIPAQAISGQTYARFRLSTGGVSSAKGAAFDGEVEDYAIVIEPPEQTTAEFGPGELFGEGDTFGLGGSLSSIDTADFDGDGDLDVVATGAGRDEVFLYENMGCDKFSRHIIDDNIWRPQQVASTDIDQDGDVDIVATSRGTLILYINEGDGIFVKETTNEYIPEFDISVVEPVDLDTDGDIDLLVGTNPSIYGGLAWYENKGEGNFDIHEIAAGSVNGITAADYDQDGDIDIATSASGFQGELQWYRNDGNQRFETLVFNVNTADFYSVHSADLDGDGNVDIAYAGRGKLGWYRNDGSGMFSHQVVRDRTSTRFWSVQASDIDGDGDKDLLVSVPSSTSIQSYENQGNGTFIRNSIGVTAGILSTVSGDFDSDGDLDLLSVRQRTGPLHIYENLNVEPSGDFDRDGDVDGSDFLTWQRGFATHSATFSLDDFDRDGDIDGSDFLTWQRGFGTHTATMSEGDANADQCVNGHDLTIWSSQFGKSGSPVSLGAIESASNNSSEDEVPETGIQSVVVRSDTTAVESRSLLIQTSVANAQATSSRLAEWVYVAESTTPAGSSFDKVEFGVLEHHSISLNANDTSRISSKPHQQLAKEEHIKTSPPDSTETVKAWLTDELLEKVFG